jgi:hypothetical protein
MCFVLYFATLTGFGLSLATASHIRVLLIVMCVAFLICLAAKQLVAPTPVPRRRGDCRHGQQQG